MVSRADNIILAGVVLRQVTGDEIYMFSCSRSLVCRPLRYFLTILLTHVTDRMMLSGLVKPNTNRTVRKAQTKAELVICDNSHLASVIAFGSQCPSVVKATKHVTIGSTALESHQCS